MIRGHLQQFAPHILANPHFQCSESFIRQFLHDKLGWSHCTVTRAAQKTPVDWENKCEDAFLQIAYQVSVLNLPAKAILNGDQTGLAPIPLSKYTWAPQGSKQVDGFGKDEKQQFTLMITTSCSGEFLPVQCIWAGKTAASLPTAQARRVAESEGHIFTSGGERHWSTFLCMQEVQKFLLNIGCL